MRQNVTLQFGRIYSLKMLKSDNLFLFVGIILGLFWIANELIGIISKILNWSFWGKSAEKCTFKTSCRADLNLGSKYAKNQDNSVKTKFVCVFLIFFIQKQFLGEKTFFC